MFIRILNKVLDPRVFVVTGLLLGVLASFLPQTAIMLLAMTIGAGLGAYSIQHLIITMPFIILFEAGFIGGVAVGLFGSLGVLQVLVMAAALIVVFIVSMLAGLLLFLLANSGFNALSER